MGLMDLSLAEILQGSLTLLYVLIVFKLGFKIISRSFEKKSTEKSDINYLYFGIFFIFLSSPMWAVAFSFVTYVLFDDTLELLLILGINWIFIGLINIWWMCLLHIFKVLKKEFLSWIIYCTTTISLEIFIIFSLITDPSMIGTTTGRFTYQTTIVLTIYAIFGLSFGSYTLAIFLKHNLKSIDPHIQWRAKLILIGWTLYVIALSLAVVGQYYQSSFYSLLLTVMAVILVMSAFSYYFAFFMPDRFANWLIKDYDGILEESTEQKSSLEEFIGTFVKPQSITEEEVSISKEKKICLVCKNKISRLNYICPECNAFYCVKCSDVLVNLENACWVCDAPFDESKPSTPFKDREETMDLEISKDAQKDAQK